MLNSSAHTHICFQNEACFAILPVSILTSSCLYYHGVIRCNKLHTRNAVLEAAVATLLSVFLTGVETGLALITLFA